MEPADSSTKIGVSKVLYGAKEIAKHVFGDDGAQSERRTRAMIRKGDLPTFKSGAIICANADNIDAAIARMGSGDVG